MKKYLIQLLAFIFIFIIILFSSKGTILWINGWIYIILLSSAQLIILYYIKDNKVLIEDRSNIQSDRNLDKILAGIMALYGPILISLTAGLDNRINNEVLFNNTFVLIGILIALIGIIISILAIKENKFFYGTAKIDINANHSVCSSGIYKVIRHPGYLGAILFDIATPIILNSMWAFIPMIITILIIVVRTSQEDLFLQRNLKGYTQYQQTTKFKLIPLIW